MLVRRGALSGSDAVAVRSQTHHELFVPFVLATGGSRACSEDGIRDLIPLDLEGRKNG
jgi:hypothetical protein